MKPSRPSSASVEESRFRITAWPGSVVPVPPVEQVVDVTLDANGLCFAFPNSFAALPDELVIRELLELDIADHEQLRAFVESYGFIFDNEYVDGATFDTVTAKLSEVQGLARWLVDVRSGGTPSTGHIEWFADRLNVGLQAFSVRIEAGPMDRPHPDLYQALCLQLYNLYVEGLSVTTCALCGSRFVRQRGRAEHGQYRTSGVTFCSKSCARAQANRDYRRRKKENHE